MDRPRIFLSAVSEELRTARQAVSRTVRTLGFDPVSQDDFSTGYGELRQWLQEQIDTCEGMIQLLGQGYGAEPPAIDQQYGRISYTQFEFLYAGQKGKKTWVFVIGQEFPRDKPIDQLDLPREAGHPDPAAYQAVRRGLQQAYLARLTRENHLRHTAKNAIDLDNIVLRLRDDLRELRQQWENWQQNDAQFKNETTDRLKKLQEAHRLTTEKIRAHLLETAEQTYRRELAGAEAETTWRKRQTLREEADKAHALRLSRLEEVQAIFAELEGRGTGSSVFQELTWILAEQGVDEALAYMETQRFSIFQNVRARAEAARQRNRADLQPLLQTAALQQLAGQISEPRLLYQDILDIEPDWPDALHQAFWFFTDQGDLARIQATLSETSQEYEQAHQMAQRLLESDPRNTEWQRDLSVSYDNLGNVAVAQGQLEQAAQAYGDSLVIGKRLAESDPRNTQWQRDLSVSYWQLANLSEREGRTRETQTYWKQAFEMLAGIDQRGLQLSPDDRKVLDVLRDKVRNLAS